MPNVSRWYGLVEQAVAAPRQENSVSQEITQFSSPMG